MRRTDSKWTALGFLPCRRGLTLVEILLAAGILAIVITGFLVSLTVARRTAAMARNEINAVAAARQKMEELLLCPFNSPDLSVGTHTLSNGRYTVSSTNPAMKTIDLVLEWCEPLSSITSSVALQTTITTTLHE